MANKKYIFHFDNMHIVNLYTFIKYLIPKQTRYWEISAQPRLQFLQMLVRTVYTHYEIAIEKQ
jgi:hypothetical protein